MKSTRAEKLLEKILHELQTTNRISMECAERQKLQHEHFIKKTDLEEYLSKCVQNYIKVDWSVKE